MKKLIWGTLAVYAFTLSCSLPNLPDEKGVETIDVVKAFEKRTVFRAEDVIATTEYIPLQTGDAYLVGKNPHFFVTAAYILAVADKQILLFDRKSGAFIREIGRCGDGPGTYLRTDYMGGVNEKDKTVSAFTGKGKCVYSFEGEVVDTLALPPMVYEMGEVSPGRYAGFVPNLRGNEKNKLLLFDKQATVVKTFPNYQSTPPPEGFHFWKPNGWMYRAGEKLSFCELFNDTIFRIRPDSLLPAYALNMGIYQPPYERQNSNFATDDYFMMQSVCESARFLFYTYAYQQQRYLLVYDKKEKKTFMNKYDEEFGGVISQNGFAPFTISGVSATGELIGFWDACDIARWFLANADRSAALPAAFQGLKNVHEMDNPVVLVAKLKP